MSALARPPWIARHHTTVNVFGANGYAWPGRAACPIRALVIHTADGTYSGSISWAANPDAEASFHYIVGKDGRVAEVVDPFGALAPWANGIQDGAATELPPHLADLAAPGRTVNANWVTVSVELEGKPFEPDFPTEAQYRRLGELGAWLCLRTGLVPVEGQTILPHRAFDTVRRPNCCGPRVDLGRIQRAIETAGQTPPPSGFVVGDGVRAALERVADEALGDEQYHHANSPAGVEYSLTPGRKGLYIWVPGAGIYVASRRLLDDQGKPV